MQLGASTERDDASARIPGSPRDKRARRVVGGLSAARGRGADDVRVPGRERAVENLEDHDGVAGRVRDVRRGERRGRPTLARLPRVWKRRERARGAAGDALHHVQPRPLPRRHRGQGGGPRARTRRPASRARMGSEASEETRVSRSGHLPRARRVVRKWSIPDWAHERLFISLYSSLYTPQSSLGSSKAHTEVAARRTVASDGDGNDGPRRGRVRPPPGPQVRRRVRSRPPSSATRRFFPAKCVSGGEENGPPPGPFSARVLRLTADGEAPLATPPRPASAYDSSRSSARARVPGDAPRASSRSRSRTSAGKKKKKTTRARRPRDAPPPPPPPPFAFARSPPPPPPPTLPPQRHLGDARGG